MTQSLSSRSLLAIAALSVAVLLGALQLSPSPAVLSAWQGPGAGRGIVAQAAPITGEAAAVPDGWAALESYSHGSTLVESAGGGAARYFRRELPGGGTLAYIAVALGDPSHVQLITADGATPGSDASGDTIWVGGGQHLATVQQMAAAPHAARAGYALVGAANFGFFGARTSSEGTVMINGQVLRVNPWRGALCITAQGRAEIGLFDEAGLRERGCEQAAGAGPVFIQGGKIANPAVSAPEGEFIPFNPLGENFAQLGWRITSYGSTLAKTAVCIGERPGGGSFLVLATSYGVTGIDLARAMLAMGCTDALGADDDTSTQMVWRGAPAASRPPRAVPDALAIYVRE